MVKTDKMMYIPTGIRRNAHRNDDLFYSDKTKYTVVVLQRLGELVEV